jgi:hypothetical protein
MLKGKFENCYGLKDFELEIDFTLPNNKAIIYAPNGIMKTSLAKVFEDISQANQTTDRIFGKTATYKIKYNNTVYDNTNLNVTDNIYVINSFLDNFDLSTKTMSKLLADQTIRQSYDLLISNFSEDIKQFENDLAEQSSLPKNKIKEQIIKDFELDSSSDWEDIFKTLTENIRNYIEISCFEGLVYNTLFNDKTELLFRNPSFLVAIENYLIVLNSIINENEILSSEFNDYNAQDLGKSLLKNNLFKANHFIVLKNGTRINDVEHWNREIQNQLQEITDKASESSEFDQVQKLMIKNQDVKDLRQLIMNNMGIIQYFSNIPEFKRLVWLHYLSNLSENFMICSNKVLSYSENIKRICQTASVQAEIWEKVVNEFNRRFRVPFIIKIKNKANFLLKDEKPHLYFTYMRLSGTSTEETEDFEKDKLLPSLSMGERRAMYLLYTLFEVERIKSLAISDTSKKYLIIADDIADSFDYKNKYAIIEYLNDISKIDNIDLLVLTHNFDFYRAVMLQVNIVRPNCFIVYKEKNENLIMSEFKYRNDFFRKVILNSIKDGNIDKNKYRMMIACIPFCRNICEYLDKDKLYDECTALLHIKNNVANSNITTKTATIDDFWKIIQPLFGLEPLNISNKTDKMLDIIEQTADDICDSITNEVFLENKIVLSIAIRLKTELYLENYLNSNGYTLPICTKNQTREWYNSACSASNIFLPEKKSIIEKVLLMTPESIHLNSFMYEPIIDMSDWSLMELYKEVKNL